MPTVGEIKRGYEIGKNHQDHHKWLWHSCVDCGKERWVLLRKGIPTNLRCHPCGARQMWGTDYVPKSKRADGYIVIKLRPDDPYYTMADKNHYVLEHRLVMAKYSGRCLLKSEHVHHFDSIKDHNTPNNLEIISPTNHTLRTMYCDKCELKKETRLLRWQIKELKEQIQRLTTKLMGI